MKPDELHPGLIVFAWHDSGCFGAQPMYCEVVRVNRVTATIRWERSGLIKRLPFHVLVAAASDQEDARRFFSQEGGAE